jgi:hypothetical protein
MTEKQRYALYFPAWSQAAQNHGWNRRGLSTRVPFFGNPQLNELYQRIWQIALERAQGTKGPSAEHFRHACHLVAFGEDKSSNQLNNQEVDRIVALFRMLANPDDLAATLAWSNPQEEKRKRMLWWIENNCTESYVIQVSREKFQTANWQALTFDQLTQLHMTLKNRSNATHP